MREQARPSAFRLFFCALRAYDCASAIGLLAGIVAVSLRRNERVCAAAQERITRSAERCTSSVIRRMTDEVYPPQRKTPLVFPQKNGGNLRTSQQSGRPMAKPSHPRSG